MQVRKTLIGLAAISAFALALPASAHNATPDSVNKQTHTFTGAVPCAVACSYWVNNGFTPCEAPFPPGAFLDKKTSAAPAPGVGKIAVLEGTLDMQLDWDSFFCADTTARTELAQGANILGDPCDNILGGGSLAPVGCHEDLSTPVVGGQTVIFRAYNWSDAGSATGKSWVRII